MKPQKPPPEQDDLWRSRLVEMIDLRHELVKLAALIDWEVFERECAGLFPSHTGRPAISTRLVAGLLYLQHAYALSDEAVVARWAENPYWQHFCGEVFFQHRLPLDPSSLTRWRKRIGEEGVEWMLTETIEAGKRAGTVKGNDLKRVTVDTTVMEKTIAHPTDARLYETARRKMVGLARARPGSACAKITTVSDPGWPDRSDATPMPVNSNGCARRCAGSRATRAGCCATSNGNWTRLRRVHCDSACWS